MDLSHIKGLGPAKIEALQAAGIRGVEDLAGLDLRRNVKVQGVTTDALKDLKQRARRALAAEGSPIPKARYSRNRKAPAQGARKGVVTQFGTKPERPAEPVKGEKRGFLRRILTRNA